MKTINEEIQSSFTTEQIRAVVNLMYTANYMKYWQNDVFKTFDCTMQQYNILRILSGSHPEKLTMQEVVKRMFDKSPNATRLANKLLKKGYIERKNSNKDKRVIYVKISEKGLSFLNDINKVFLPMLTDVSQKLSSEEAESLNNLLDKLRA